MFSAARNNLNRVFQKLKNCCPKSQSGFSLIEIIIVIAIIGALVGLIASRLAGGRDNANLKLTNTKAASLQTKIIQYQTDNNNQIPTTEQGLDVLMKERGGVAIASQDDLTDAWGNKFKYKKTDMGAVFISSGKDPSNPSDALCYLNGKTTDCDKVNSGS